MGVGMRIGQVVGLVGDLCCRQWRRHLRIRVVTDLDLGNPDVEGGRKHRRRAMRRATATSIDEEGV